MATAGEHQVRRAGAEDMPAVARLLHEFNTEFDDPTPGVPFLTARAGELLAAGELAILIAGAGPEGLATVRLRPSVWTDGFDAYLEELYVVPGRRGEGFGRALLEGAMELARERGATRMDLGTADTDTAARALYESAGFTNYERPPDRSQLLFYERDL